MESTRLACGAVPADPGGDPRADKTDARLPLVFRDLSPEEPPGLTNSFRVPTTLGEQREDTCRITWSGVGRKERQAQLQAVTPHDPSPPTLASVGVFPQSERPTLLGREGRMTANRCWDQFSPPRAEDIHLVSKTTLVPDVFYT